MRHPSSTSRASKGAPREPTPEIEGGGVGAYIRPVYRVFEVTVVGHPRGPDAEEVTYPHASLARARAEAYAFNLPARLLNAIQQMHNLEELRLDLDALADYSVLQGQLARALRDVDELPPQKLHLSSGGEVYNGFVAKSKGLKVLRLGGTLQSPALSAANRLYHHEQLTHLRLTIPTHRGTSVVGTVANELVRNTVVAFPQLTHLAIFEDRATNEEDHYSLSGIVYVSPGHSSASPDKAANTPSLLGIPLNATNGSNVARTPFRRE